jgi:hypothetical protein
MPWQPHTVFASCLKAGGVEDDFTGFSSVFEPNVTESAPTAPSNELGDRDVTCSTLRDEMQPFL